MIRPSRLSAWQTKLSAPFTRYFWEDLFERNEDERLVDNKLLSYAYLEAGMIEMLGRCACFGRIVLILSDTTMFAVLSHISSSSTRMDSAHPICVALRRRLLVSQ